jgi:hypothetical protein
MDISLIALYALAVIGPIMIFLTRFVLKGRSRDMTRLWFITFFSYVIFYWLAKSYDYFIDSQGVVYVFSLLWPVAAILAFWTSEKLTEKGSLVPFFKWMVYFLIAVLFAIILDGAAGLMHWYTYNSSIPNVELVSIINPISGTPMPALMPFLMGVLMMSVFFLVFNVHKQLRKRRIDETSATLLLGALSVVMGGLLWVASDLILGFIRSML